MGGEAGVETGIGTALSGEGNRGEWDEQPAVWFTEAHRSQQEIQENRLGLGITLCRGSRSIRNKAWGIILQGRLKEIFEEPLNLVREVREA